MRKKDGSMRRVIATLAVGLLLFNGYAQFPNSSVFPGSQPSPGPSVTITHVVTPNARYSLVDGIDVAIRNVKRKGGNVTPESVLEELYEMAKANDVRLPYHYSYRGGGGTFKVKGHGVSYRGKPSEKYLTAEDQRAKNKFEMQVARRCAEVTGQDVSRYDMSQFSQPNPRDYKTQVEFVKAYVGYKMRNVDENVRARYAKRIGGMGDYRRDLQKEANTLWRNR